MDFGIFMPPVADSWKMAQRAEALGFSRVWFYDTQMLNSELFAIMGATAMVTKKIRLGTGVMIPSNRIAPVAALVLATPLRELPSLLRTPEVASALVVSLKANVLANACILGIGTPAA